MNTTILNNVSNMKSYTDLEQSKKLAEFLPFESADMYYSNHSLENYYSPIPHIGNYSAMHNQIPCWSLSALLSVIPKHIKEYNTLRIDIGEKDFSIWYDEVGYGVNTELPNITMEEPVDAAFEMVVQLKENKKI